MIASSPITSFTNQSWHRDQFLTLLNTALSVVENKYARRLAVMWLSTFPGDLQVRLLYARSLLAEETQSLKQQALQILEEICLYDPEFVEAQKCLLKAQHSFGLASAEETSNCVLALGGTSLHLAHSLDKNSSWAMQLRKTRRILLDNGKKLSPKTPSNLEQAETLIHQVLVANPKTPLAAVTHLRVIQALGTMPNAAVHSIAKAYYDRWPKCLPILLFYAHTSMEGSDTTMAVSLLHTAVSMDITGQVPHRLWGEDHPYRSMWLEKLEIDPGLVNSPQNIPIPARVAAAYGWNQLPSFIEPDNKELSPSLDNQLNEVISESVVPAETFPYANSSNEPQKVKSSPVRTKSSGDLNREGRFPIYVVFSTRLGLEQHYGAHAFPLIKEAMSQLVQVVRGRRIGHQNWGALLFLADDAEICAALDIKSAQHNDPWSLKLAIHDLDRALGRRGERIGAVIIIGGHEVVPFHHLPNPVEDIDRDVPSDNPYGTRDENYFVLEWPVGRLPGGADADSGNLINLIHAIVEQHQYASRPVSWYHLIRDTLHRLFSRTQKRSTASLGYSAAVWRRASLAVFRSIGDPRSLLISPPTQACDLDCTSNTTAKKSSHYSDISLIDQSCLVLPPAQFGYFNLHGLSDTCEWYGQRDPTDPTEGPDFPIALRPQDIRNSGHAPRVVFSEACYGAYIHGKKVEETISIKFLISGTLAIVGSTSTCYGSITSPLIAADLLGRVYWGLISEGNHAGEALRRAKLYLAREMHQRQGFLDGEDQKTLISFVLYGDPLAQPSPSTGRHKMIKIAPQVPVQLLTLSDQRAALIQENAPTPEITAHVKQVVKQYLPGMVDAQVKLNRSTVLRTACGQPLTSNSCNAKNHIDPQGRRVIILSKRIEQANQQHPQIARLTMDKTGRLIKLVVSR